MLTFTLLSDMRRSVVIASLTAQILSSSITNEPIVELIPMPPISQTLTCTTRVCSTTGRVFKCLQSLYKAGAIPAPRLQLKVKLVGTSYKCVPVVANCSKNLVPVCGLDGDFYTNPCNLLAAGDRMSLEYHPNRGKCEKSCPKIYSPICDQNGAKYDNACLLPACFTPTQCPENSVIAQNTTFETSQNV